MAINAEKYAQARVIRMSEALAGDADSLWPIPTEALASRVELLQDEAGRIFLTRASRDGIVQAYRLDGADGKPLRIEARYRGARGG